jgi:hypothetical protein
VGRSSGSAIGDGGSNFRIAQRELARRVLGFALAVGRSSGSAIGAGGSNFRIAQRELARHVLGFALAVGRSSGSAIGDGGSNLRIAQRELARRVLGFWIGEAIGNTGRQLRCAKPGSENPLTAASAAGKESLRRIEEVVVSRYAFTSANTVLLLDEQGTCFAFRPALLRASAPKGSMTSSVRVPSAPTRRRRLSGQQLPWRVRLQPALNCPLRNSVGRAEVSPRRRRRRR